MVELDKNQDLDAEAPEFVLLDEQSSALLQRAQDLALNGREDAGAVEELVRMASGNRRSLQLGALGARQWGQHRDYSSSNRAHRLLEAALSGGPVAAVSPSERARVGFSTRSQSLSPPINGRSS